MITNQIMNEVKIKKGSIIMCTSNIDVENGICNGSQGIIEECSSTLEGPTIRFYNGKKRKLDLQLLDMVMLWVQEVLFCLFFKALRNKIKNSYLLQMKE